MARPPLKPINGTEDYFDKLLQEVSVFFDNNELPLSFKGYKDTVEAYSTLTPTDYERCWVLSRDFNMWGDYFSNLKALTERMFLNTETEKKKEYATASILEDCNKVANGDRLANKNLKVVELRKNRNLLQSFLTVLDAKIDYCYKCHHHCKATWTLEKQLVKSI